MVVRAANGRKKPKARKARARSSFAFGSLGGKHRLLRSGRILQQASIAAQPTAIQEESLPQKA